MPHAPPVNPTPQPPASQPPEAARWPWVAIVTRGVIAVILIAAGIGFAQALVATKPQLEVREQSRGLPTVRVMEIQRHPVARQWQGYGRVAAMDSADVPARVTATVIEVPDDIDPGQRVDKGQLLARLDPSDFERELDAARATLDELNARISQIDVEEDALRQRRGITAEELEINEDEYERIREILEANATARRDLDAAQRTLLQSRRELVLIDESLSAMTPRRAQLQALIAGQRARIAAAELSLDRTRIVSPIAGVLQTVDVEVGENIAAGMRVARVIDPRRLEIAIDLPSAARNDVERGDPMTILVNGLSKNREVSSFDTVVSRVAPEADATRATFTAYTVIDAAQQPQAADMLSPGLFVEARVAGHAHEPRIAVPRRSIRGGRVLLVRGEQDEGVIESVAIDSLFVYAGRLASPALPDDQWSVLAEGAVQPGDRILLNASASVKDGQRVIAQPIE